MENQLVKIIDESGLDKTKAQVLLENFSNYFEIASDWENKAKALVVTNVEQRAEMKMAREGRLFLKDKRVAVEKTRKALKENALREGQTIDAIAKILTNLILPIEEDLEHKEKFIEILEAQKRAELKAQREAEIQPYAEFVPVGMDFGSLDEQGYATILSGAKAQLQARVDAEKKATEERLAKEKAEAEEREKMKAENERLKKEAEEREKQAKIEADKRAKAEAERKAKEEAERKARDEKERKEREAYEAKLKAEREDNERIQREEKAKREKLETELRAKEEAERKAREEEEAKIQLELSKGDSDKVKDLIKDLESLKTKYSFKSAKNKKMYEDVSVLIDKIVQYIQK